jgi:hypothetical protein
MGGFSRSSLWQLVCTVVKYGPLLLWLMIPQKSPLHTSFILDSWKDSWVPKKVLILTACSAKQIRCPFFSIGSAASYDSGTVYSLRTILFLRKLCRLTYLQIEVIRGLTRFCTHSKIPYVSAILNAIRSR